MQVVVRRVAALALASLLAVPAGAAGAVVDPGAQAARGGTTVTSAGPTRLPATALPAVLATLGASDPALAARGYGALVALDNDAAGLAVTAGPTGTRVTVGDGSVVMVPAALGRGTTPAALPAGDRAVADGNTVTTTRGDGLTEWLINAPGGLEQGFTIAADPAPALTGQLVLSMEIDGDLAARAFLASPTRLAFTGTRLAWDGLAAWDAAGRVLPARLALDGERLSVIVDDAHAVYPVTIDPAWVQQASLKASNTGAGDTFGLGVAISGDTTVIGAYQEDSCDTGSIANPSDDACSTAGAAYVFTRTGSAWSQQASLKASNTATNDAFGYSVAIAVDTIVVGAYGEGSCDTGAIVDPTDDGCGDAGSAYVFTRSGTTWSEQVALKAGNTGAGDEFGDGVAVSGDTIVVGAGGESSCGAGSITSPDDDTCAGAGAAYVYVRDVAGPKVGSVRANPARPAAGVKVKVSAVASDPSGVVSAQVRIGKGKAVAMRGVNGFGKTTQRLSGSVRFSGSGVQSVCVRATDGEGNRSPWRCTKVTVAALDPVPSPVPSPEPGTSPQPGDSPAPGSSPAPSPAG